MREKPDCESCRQLAEFKNKETNCVACIPPLFPENEDPMLVYGIVQSQVLTAGMSGEIVDLNHLALWAVIDKYKIRNEVECFEKVLTVAHHIHQMMRDERPDT